MGKKKGKRDGGGGEKLDKLNIKGIVEEALPNAMFKVRSNTGTIILATLSGKIRVNRIRILPGDCVIVEVSAYDTSRGRITWRGK